MRLRHRDTETEEWVGMKFTKFPADEKRMHYQLAIRDTTTPLFLERCSEVDYREHLIIIRYVEWFYTELII